MTSRFVLLLTRRWFIFLTLSILPFLSYSQARGPGIVTGRIIDSQLKTPVEYANVILRDTTSKEMVKGIVSDSSGFFRIDDVPVGTYVMEYSFIGYKKQQTKAITIDRKKPKVEMGALGLTSAAINMEEVTITGERNMMINKIDRKVFNVQKDISAQTGTVTDVLQTIPSVSVDIDGNISLRGSGNVTILINGRPSVMTGMANLEQMPASLVERIEIITNPSAKYQPDGTGGIINIILKKERKAGFNGILGANAGNRERLNTNLQLNYNTGRVNIFGSYGFRLDSRLRSGELSSQTIDTATGQSVYLDQSSEGRAVPKSNLGQLGFEWEISDKDAAGLSGTYTYRKVDRDDVTYNIYSNNEQVPDEQFTRSMEGVEQEKSAGLNAFYEHIFDREREHLLRIDFEYQGDRETEDDSYTTVYALPVYPNGMDQTHGKNSEQQLSLAIDYSRPLWKDASLETGYQGEMQLSGQDTKVQTWEQDTMQWVADPGLSNNFFGNQTIHALYATLSYNWKNFAVMGGLRAEEALIYLDFKSLDTTEDNSYFALYPTLHMSLSHGKNEWQLNYSRRVNRPDVEDMNPVPEYRDPRNYFVGNPDLKPEDIHSFEVGYAFRTDNLNLVPTLFYRYKVNGFSWVTTPVNDTVLQTTIENLDKDQSAGLDLSGTWNIAKIANINFSASGFYSQIDASSIGYSSHKSTFSWNAKLNASFSITKSTLFQLNTQYRAKALTAQGWREPTWVLNLGLRQDLWKKKVSLILTVSDLFNSQVWKNSVDTPELIQNSMRKRDGRVFYLGFVYNFGTNGKKTKETKFEFDNGMEN
jgi:outer membrane receptor protein involved in Fe transport